MRKKKKNSMVLSVDVQLYQDHCKEVNRLLSGAREKYFTDQVNSVAGDHKKLFRVSKSLLDQRSEQILPDNIPTKELCERFSEFFFNKIRNNIEKINSACGSSFSPSVLREIQPGFTELHSHNLYHSHRLRCINLSQGAQPSHVRQIHSRHGYQG